MNIVGEIVYDGMLLSEKDINDIILSCGYSLDYINIIEQNNIIKMEHKHYIFTITNIKGNHKDYVYDYNSVSDVMTKIRRNHKINNLLVEH